MSQCTLYVTQHARYTCTCKKGETLLHWNWNCRWCSFSCCYSRSAYTPLMCPLHSPLSNGIVCIHTAYIVPLQWSQVPVESLTAKNLWLYMSHCYMYSDHETITDTDSTSSAKSSTRCLLHKKSHLLCAKFSKPCSHIVYKSQPILHFNTRSLTPKCDHQTLGLSFFHCRWVALFCDLIWEGSIVFTFHH